jgi:Family of unknown function (DUF5689)
MKTSIKTLLAVVMLLGIINACNKKFDEPPYATAASVAKYDSMVNCSIKKLKALHPTSGTFDKIDSNYVVSGVVIGNDRTGNLYKQIYIQDATGAIGIKLESSGLFPLYPVGMKIYLKCKGLYISDYGKQIQIGALDVSVPGNNTMTGIHPSAFDDFIKKGTLNNPYMVYKVASPNDLSTNPQDSLVGNLISLNNMEFGTSDLSRTWADTSAFKASVSLTIRDCSKTPITIRTSGYSNFAGQNPPKGNGTITALYTIFGTSPTLSPFKQLVVLDPNDLKFTGDRCFVYEDDFSGYTVSTACLNIAGWKNIQESGDVCFQVSSFSGNVFAKASAFSSTALPTTNITSWLITPKILIPSTGIPKFSFTCARRYPIGTLKVLISKDYTGNNTPATATWIPLDSVPAGPATAFTQFEPFGPYNLSSYLNQNINIAFKYEAPAGTSKFSVATYQVDDIKITKN